ncbi:MAG: hypothetical protein GF347_04190 [Candidatus Moranbacteria bacterium]|nr:hypothetical protein [Candidatus Moranbacteria bacterium]
MNKNLLFVLIFMVIMVLGACSSQDQNTADGDVNITIYDYTDGHLVYEGNPESAKLYFDYTCEYEGFIRQFWWVSERLSGKYVWEVISSPIDEYWNGFWLIKGFLVEEGETISRNICIYVVEDTPEEIAAAIKNYYQTSATFSIYYPQDESGDIVTEFLLIEE